MRLYVGSLHFNITEEMLRGIFEPFGRVSLLFLCSHWCCCIRPHGGSFNPSAVSCLFLSQIESIQLIMDSETGRSKGYGFISVRVFLWQSRYIQWFNSIMDVTLYAACFCTFLQSTDLFASGGHFFTILTTSKHVWGKYCAFQFMQYKNAE